MPISFRTIGIAVVALALTAVPAAAQDWMGNFDAAGRQQQAIAQNQIGGHMVRQSIRRQGRQRRPTSRQVATCANKGKFRAQYGAGNSKVKQLYGLCRNAGL